MYANTPRIKRNTVIDIQKLKNTNKKISVLTAYDHTMAQIIDNAGIDMILVGDSLGMVIQGEETTLTVTVEDIIYHTKLVVKGSQKALIIADMPFMSYQINKDKAIENALKIIKETGCNAVKLEGGEKIIPIIEHLTNFGIPVFGHLGLTPQSINKFGSYKTRAKKDDEANTLFEDAKKLEEAGVSGIFLEKIPAELAKKVTESLSVPTIGIGAGNGCAGQVLVSNDMLGIDGDINFKFVRKYADLSTTISDGVKNYISDVKDGSFPNSEESY